MSVGLLLHWLGHQKAVDNARLASIELSRRRVEREAVELFLERLAARSSGVCPGRVAGHR